MTCVFINCCSTYFQIVLAKQKKKYNEKSKNNPLTNNYEQLKKVIIILN